MTEGQRLKTLRDETELNQTDFGARIRLSKAAISNIEKDYRSLTPKNRLAICREFGVREEWLRDGIEPMYEESAEYDTLMKEVNRLITSKPDSFKRRLVELILRLTPEQCETLEQYARQLVGGSEHVETPEERAQKRANDFYEEALAEEKVAVESSALRPTDAQEA